MNHQNDLKRKKIAIVYDWIDKWGGVERILLTIHEMFPRADFFASYYDKKEAPWANNLRIKTSFIQKLPSFIKENRLLSLPFYPYAFESFDFSSYDLVISVTSSFAKAVITKPNIVHICYLLTPTRFLWLYPETYTNNLLKKILFTPFMTRLKEWDFVAAKRPDHYISISKTVQQRLKKYYREESEVIYPPFDEEYWNKINSRFKAQSSKLHLRTKNYFLVVSRLEKYKKVDLVIKTFNRLNGDLIIVGKGTQSDRLKKIAGGHIIFFQDIPDQELGLLYQHAQALIIPQEEDFGYTALEAQFFGCPVIAYNKGGVTETVIEGKTGVFFEHQTEESITKTLAKFHTMSYTLRNNTKKFSDQNIKEFNKKRFIKEFHRYINHH